MSKAINIAVTGAAGQIGYNLLFRIASGEVFGKDSLVHLNLLEIPASIKAAEGVAMELDDCAFPCLKGISLTTDPNTAFSNCHWALLVGSKPRGPGMERSDLLKSNGSIFVTQGRALKKADTNVRIVIDLNTCNLYSSFHRWPFFS